MYINIQTSQYPIQEFQIRSLFANTILPEILSTTWLEDNGFAKVIPVNKPTPTRLQYVEEVLPVKSGSNYYQTWVVKEHSLENKKKILLQYFNQMFDGLIGQVKATYPSTEVESWAKQEKEAREYLADNNSQSILLREIAAARGVSVDWFANKVVAKADQYALVVGNLIGTRQLLEHQILNATEENIDSIKWPPE